MKEVLEYIMANYTWFLGGAIIILLAIIGSYADKTNFGQGKQKEDNLNNDNINNDNIFLNKEEISDKDKMPTEELNEDVTKSTEEVIQDDITQNTSEENTSKNSDSKKSLEYKIDDKFDEFDEEFNQIVPEKEIIDGDLLDEIEGLSLDKTQKMNLKDLPNFGDVELPEIKGLEPEDEDIWKF